MDENLEKNLEIGWTKHLDLMGKRYHYYAAVLVAFLMMTWIIYDYYAISSLWKEVAIFRVCTALILTILATLLHFEKVPHLLVADVNAVLSYSVGFFIPILEKSQVPSWMIGYCTCFIGASLFLFHGFQRYLIVLSSVFFSVVLSILLFSEHKISFFIVNGFFTLVSTIVISALFYYLKISVLKSNFKLQEKLNISNNKNKLILETMSQGVVIVGEKLNILGVYSKSAPTILGIDNIEKCKFSELILANSHLDEDRNNQVINALYSIVGEDELNFHLNAHLLPSELKLDVKGEPKVLRFEWKYLHVLNTFCVVALFADITAQRNTEKEAREKDLELQMIKEIIESGVRNVAAFIESQEKYINNNIEILGKATLTTGDLEEMFRNMHTLKGNSRMINLSEITKLAHKIENLFAAANSNAGLDKDLYNRMMHDLERLKKIFSRYQSLIQDKLTNSSEVDSVSFMKEFDRQFKMYEISNLDKNFGLVKKIKQIINYRQLMKYSSVEEVLSPFLAAIPDIASSLGKRNPDIEITPGFMILSSKAYLINDIFNHLLRNSLDHGIEAIEDRKSMKKSDAGKICILFEHKSDFISIDYFDDGRGLNIEKLREKSSLKEGSSDELVAEEVFKSGVSTSSKVTDLSGRGVGMDAVRAFIERDGGQISIEFTGPSANGFRPFKFKILFPKENFYSPMNAA